MTPPTFTLPFQLGFTSCCGKTRACVAAAAAGGAASRAQAAELGSVGQQLALSALTTKSAASERHLITGRKRI